MTRHYAPKAELTLYEGPRDEVIKRVAADARSANAGGERIGILAPEEDLSALAPDLAARAASGRVETIPYGSRHDLDRSGRELYASIRALDATGVDRILAIGMGTEGLALALHDRLKRAADGRVRTIVQE
jgi:L-threonylcarbamoyladenylate synthase